MADPETTKSAWEFGPWILGWLATLAGAVYRSEYTNRKVNKTLYDSDTGDLRLQKIEDCEKCQTQIDQRFESEANIRSNDRKEMREDIRELHAKIDNLPEKIITMMGK